MPSGSTPILLSRFLVLTLAVTAGIAVANLYYIQPLLAEIAAAFHVTQAQVGYAATLTQVGYALGMLMILPLADIREKKSLILFMLLCSAGALLFLAFAWNSAVLSIASFAVGFTSVVPQLIVPLAAQLADPKERGRIIGTVMSGLLIGILVSRTFSGLVGEYLGWPAVYFIASGLMILLAGFLTFRLPKSPSATTAGYGALFRSMASLIKDLPLLREASLNGGMMFAAFSVFWTTLSFLLAEPRFGLGPDAAGLFGLIGVVGALAAPVAGRMADQRSPRFTIGIGMAAVILAYVCMLGFGYALAGLVVGVILLDLGVQSTQISNQARIHAISDEARNRINTIYMVSYFVGGALGSWVGSFSYAHFGWTGVCIAGLLTQLIAVYAQVRGRRRELGSRSDASA
ncbi:MFS transporter [Paenibacillus sp. MBLB2552]|uniref:MFS transporter n=1 Tax=Paenibacillus mellifer TaxID=2937794 RepID=A0A9X1XUL0_9BACL|nr:MFS transporter [Paenibacillus mellifer]MCK8485589.1 MFS transporter [Paenibacillus mellifer]